MRLYSQDTLDPSAYAVRNVFREQSKPERTMRPPQYKLRECAKCDSHNLTVQLGAKKRSSAQIHAEARVPFDVAVAHDKQNDRLLHSALDLARQQQADD